MKLRLHLILTAFLALIVISGCGEKAVPDPVEGFTTYTDEAVKFEIQHPKNWHVARKTMGERIEIYSSKAGMTRFNFSSPENYAKGLPTARIILFAVKLDSVKDLDKIFEDRYMMFQKDIYSNPEKLTIDGIQVTKRNYAFQLDDGRFEGEIYIGAKDSAYASVLYFEAFSEKFAEYKKSAFEKVLASWKLAQTPSFKKDTVVQLVEADPPSSTFKSASGEGFTIQIPDNFKSERARGAAGALFSTLFIGDRRGDCYVAVVIKDASKQNDIKKIADETSKSIAGASNPAAASLGGQNAYTIQYTQSTKEGPVKTKMYFVIRGTKLYQVAMTWNTSKEADVYQPILEKSLNSIKFQ